MRGQEALEGEFAVGIAFFLCQHVKQPSYFSVLQRDKLRELGCIPRDEYGCKKTCRGGHHVTDSQKNLDNVLMSAMIV